MTDFLGVLLVLSIFAFGGWMIWMQRTRKPNALSKGIVPGMGLSGACWVRACAWGDGDCYRLIIEGPTGVWRHTKTHSETGYNDHGQWHRAEPVYETDPDELAAWRLMYGGHGEREVVGRVPINPDHQVVTARTKPGPILDYNPATEEFEWPSDAE